jgi:DNA-binding LacI/PurR family transcriptional regulator
MHSLLRLRYSVPGDVRIVGIDDLELARLLPVPLTTLRQPTYDIGQAAIAAMLDRVRRTDLPARDILLQCDLVVRQSCGAQRADGILPA